MCMTTLKEPYGISWSFKKESKLYLPYGYNYVFVQSVGNKTTTKRMHHSQKGRVDPRQWEQRLYCLVFCLLAFYIFNEHRLALNAKKKTKKNHPILFKNKYKKTFQNSWKVLEHFGTISESGSGHPPILILMQPWSCDPTAWWPAVIRAMK